jgi:hypothetical protein
MEKLLKDIRTASKKYYTLAEQDRDDVIQNSLMYCYLHNVTDLPMSYVKQLVKTQVLQLLRPSYFKINLLTDSGELKDFGTSLTEKLEDSIYAKDIFKCVMKVSNIPENYRRGVAVYLSTDGTYEEVAESLSLDKETIRHYLSHNKDSILKALTDPKYKNLRHRAAI